MKLVWGLTALMIAVGAVAWWIWRSAPEAAPCAMEVLQSSTSPDGRTLAEALTERCDGSLTTHVTLRRAAAPEAARADVFVARGAATVSLAWDSNGLRIVSAAPPVVQETSWHGTPIRIHH